MVSSTRPAPLSLGPFRSFSGIGSPESPESMTRTMSNDDMLFQPYLHNRRTETGISTTSSYSYSKSPSRKPTTPTANAHSYCGRHTDQFLFGGKSPFAGLWRAVRNKN